MLFSESAAPPNPAPSICAPRSLKGEVNLRAAAVAAGHHAGETTAVPSGEPDAEASIPPARQLLPVAIASDPAGARIEIENIDSGRTPAIVKLQPGEYRVTLTLPGYETWQEKFTVAANPGPWPRL